MTVKWTRLAVAGALVALAAVASLWPDPFRLDRVAVEAGELWRLVTGHLVHATWAHFAFDVGIGCLLLCLLPLRRSLWLLPLFVGAVVLTLRPDLIWYDGLSGVLHGWTVLVALHVIQSGDRIEKGFAGLLLLGVAGKAVIEAGLGISIFTGSFDMGDVTVYEAHLIGVLGGFLTAGLDTAWPRLVGSPAPS